MKTAMIIGVSGQDGAYLARFLLEKGYRVIGTSRDHEVNPFANLDRLGIRDCVSLASVDTSDFRSVITALSNHSPEEIYNLAGQTSVGMSFQYPVETFNSILIGTMNLLECIRILGYPARFYQAGSGEVYGNTIQPADESTPFRPLSPYGTAKAAASYAVANYRQAYGMFCCSGVLFNHESPLRPARFVTKKIVDAAKRIADGSGETLKLGNIDIARDWGWAPDYVEAMWLMLNHQTPDDFIISTGRKHTLRDFLCLSFETVGLDWRDHVVSDASLLRPLDIEESLGNPQKAKEMLGWNQRVNFEGMVRKLVANELF
jgi:GDPmannose 4,6-dehydratase